MKDIKKYYIYWLLFQMMFGFSCSGEMRSNEDSLLGNDYRLFKDSPVWAVAQATEDGNILELKRLLKNDSVIINFQEPKFGNTLLQLTVLNRQYGSCKTLLEAGADPNIHNTYDGTSPIIAAAGIENEQSEQFLRLLLSFNADPNDEEIGKRRVGNTTRQTPLLLACSDVNEQASPIEKVELLVEAGADINYKNEFNSFPLKSALVFGHYDVALYLLTKGADYNRMFYDRTEFDGGKVYILDILREDLVILNSVKHIEKMKVVNFLLSRGLNYWTHPIPDFVRNKIKDSYPDEWEDYLKAY